ncbi:MAG: hypothetical protein GXY34_11070 [Syntrophomonadaceae bacterium]|nr:hypothetical protein [Syntrophomonadaceae bacterium]
MTEVKIKAYEKPAIEAYWRTLIERSFRNNEDIRFCHRPEAGLIPGFLLNGGN